jgi:hypothetical protein
MVSSQSYPGWIDKIFDRLRYGLAGLVITEQQLPFELFTIIDH